MKEKNKIFRKLTAEKIIKRLDSGNADIEDIIIQCDIEDNWKPFNDSITILEEKGIKEPKYKEVTDADIAFLKKMKKLLLENRDGNKMTSVEFIEDKLDPDGLLNFLYKGSWTEHVRFVPLIREMHCEELMLELIYYVEHTHFYVADGPDKGLPVEKWADGSVTSDLILHQIMGLDELTALIRSDT